MKTGCKKFIYASSMSIYGEKDNKEQFREEDEPNPKLGILMHPKLSLTPHIGGSTEEAQSRIGIDLAGQIIQKFTPNPIDVS